MDALSLVRRGSKPLKGGQSDIEHPAVGLSGAVVSAGVVVPLHPASRDTDRAQAAVRLKIFSSFVSFLFLISDIYSAVPPPDAPALPGGGGLPDIKRPLDITDRTSRYIHGMGMVL